MKYTALATQTNSKEIVVIQYTLRRIIRIEKVSATPKKYPRRSDKIKKQPLV